MKTSLKNLYIPPVLIAWLGLLLAGRAAAQTFTNLHNFTGPDGENPQAGLIISGNTLYGACDSGGGSRIGTVFAVNTNGTGFTNLYNLTAPPGFSSSDSSPSSTNSDGAYPDGTMTLSGNTLYGTAYFGGSAGAGTVFAVNTNGTGFTNLHSFAAGSGSFPQNYTNSDGACPEAGLVISGNTLYGTTEKGGSSGLGAVFKVNSNGTGFTNLHSFTGGTNGAVPEGLALSGSTLYGEAGGLYSGDDGTVFKVNTDGTSFTNLHSFAAGSWPSALVLSGNTLYGTTYNGGSAGNGTVFAVNTNGTGFTNLYTFTATSGPLSTNSDGANPMGPMILSGNILYGTTYNGGSSGNGAVFALNTNGTGFTTLYAFTAESSGINSDGANPQAGLILSGDTLYGTAQYGGSSGYGTVFSITLPSVILSAPQITGKTNFTFVLSGPAGSNCVLQASTNLLSTNLLNWSPISTSTLPVSGSLHLTNAISGSRRFYRVFMQ
ncbi:MAG: choice-of-anchor tandem repeat GloVer-containing protein [Verrucomicrobiota bacterium]